ncbi:GNAT family N-acetyltransferase [Polymorphobacter sp. PAMC 29334]|uniref:GNAT family N-acetyltransferase n=1 Tax=Polymorphobacter sp. PAMC 29334 TaxID=2862331 RepID=UPI001D031FAC|nr:N-acetyltransferase [Polymorphobacter sp. PAMC 29334]
MPLPSEGEGRQARPDPAIDLPPALRTPMDISAATTADTPDIDSLLDAAFGPGRHARTASLLRAGAEPIAGVSLVARDGGRLLGSIQYWPIELVTGDAVTPLTLLGPVAVAADARTLGLGRRLLAASLAVADAHGFDPILLIGDASYYGPFGFDAAATGDWQLPGPVDRHRLLLRQTGSIVLPKIATVRAVNASALAAPGMSA